GFIVRADDLLGVTQQGAARFGEVEFFVYSKEQRRAGFFFELAHMNADRRLCKVYPPSRLSEGAGLGNCLKGPEQPEFHKQRIAMIPGNIRGEEVCAPRERDDVRNRVVMQVAKEY